MNPILFKQLSSAQAEKTEDPLMLLVPQVVGGKAAVIDGFGGVWGASVFL